MKYDLKIIDDYIKSIDYYNFQDFCDRLLLTLFPNDYTPVRAGGRNGDMKNDGYCYLSRIFFQAHATRGESARNTKKKIKEDLVGCLEKWTDVREFIYITNDTLIGEVENFVDELRLEFPEITIRTWSQKILIEKIRGLDLKDVEHIIDRKLILEQSITYKDTFTTKYLVTDNFNFIKEISNLELENFPFDRALILDNQVLKFTRELLKDQDYRNEELEKRIKVKVENYTKTYPDAKTFPKTDNEYQWKYHERTPTIEEIEKTIKKDCITNYLIRNKIPPHKIAKIFTCYEGECAGDGKFIENYLLRPFWAQYLIIKNISKTAIKLDTIDALKNSNVLYPSIEIKELDKIKLPNFEIEPNQNIIVPIGVFLDDFEKSEKGNEINVSNSNTSEQYQILSFGEIQKSPNIEFIGPSIVPLSISFNNENTKIHSFDFENLYWIERHWGYGSCPHLFFNFTENLKYQGEIFNNKPNQISLEQITVPRGVNAIKIAELEKEITYINYIKINDRLVYQNVILNEGDEITFEVKTNDIVTVEGYYRVLSESFRNLPKLEKNRIIKRFKKTYAKQSH
jgi:hypothetical protein